METTAKKTCKICYQEIDSRAKKCPYCQHWQYKWSMITFHPLVAMIPGMVILVVVFSFLGSMFKTTFSEGEPFSQYSGAVSVIDTEMVFGINGRDLPIVAVLGKINNRSGISWKEIHLEARFYDKDDKLIDTTQQEQYSFVAPAHDESTFKMSFRREFPQENYANFKIRILSAKDERKRF